MRIFKKVRRQVVEFCDRCARVCDARCRSAAVRARNLDRGLVARTGP